MIKKYIKKLGVLVVVMLTFSSCDIERFEPALETAEGGGTLETYAAYTIDATGVSGTNVYGRIVFWKTELDQTLVQISLYNTVDGGAHPAVLIDGAVGVGTTTMMAIDDVDGTTGELSTSKLFLISDTTFYDSLGTLDAHVSVSLSSADATVVAQGDLGLNADPVESN